MTDQAHTGHVHRINGRIGKLNRPLAEWDKCPDCIARNTACDELATALTELYDYVSGLAQMEIPLPHLPCEGLGPEIRTALTRYRGEKT